MVRVNLCSSVVLLPLHSSPLLALAYALGLVRYRKLCFMTRSWVCGEFGRGMEVENTIKITKVYTVVDERVHKR